MPETAEKKRILVVDDECEALEYIKDALEDEYVVFTAQNGETALDILSGERIDLVLLDIAMKEMDGNEALRKIRGIPGLGKVKVCIVSALMAPEQEKMSRELGADDYLVKPFRVDRLMDKVAALLDE